jgi:prepilin-type N-terminal cleavage/methylation domain-containing protein
VDGIRAESGFSLAELLVALAVLGLCLAGGSVLLASGLGAWALGSARVEAQQGARLALERLERELREAGYDPTGAGIAAVITALPQEVSFQRDLNGNGIVDPTRERVTWLLRPGDTVLRRDAGGGAQPVVEDARRFSLTYFDAGGSPTADPARVAAVAILLEVGRPGAAVTLASQVGLRNRRG